MKTIKTKHHHSPHYTCSCQGKKLSYKSLLSAVLAAFAISAVIVNIQHTPTQAQEESALSCVSRQEVETALDRELCYVIQNNKVYDLTEDAAKWDLEGHVGQHPCGKEYTDELTQQGPHDAGVVDQFYLADLCPEADSQATIAAQSQPDLTPVVGAPLPAKRFTIFGMSIRYFFAYVSLFAFVLNFATCYAMPWAKKQAPWRGDSPLPDDKDQIGRFPFTHWHAYFAWLAIFTLSVHGFLAFACSWWGFCY